MSEKKWPIVDNRTDQLSKLRPVKACECLNYLLDGRPCFRLCKVVTAGAAWLTCSTWLGSTPSAPHCGQIHMTSGTWHLLLHALHMPAGAAHDAQQHSFLRLCGRYCTLSWHLDWRAGDECWGRSQAGGRVHS